MTQRQVMSAASAAQAQGLYCDFQGQRYWFCCPAAPRPSTPTPPSTRWPGLAQHLWRRRSRTPTRNRPKDDDITMDTTPVPDTTTDVGCDTAHGYISDKDRYLARLKRIEGQARGIYRMVDEEQYCIDILTQISALTSALRNVGLGLLDDHLKHCVVDAAQLGGEASEAKIKEASDAIARLVRS